MTDLFLPTGRHRPLTVVTILSRIIVPLMSAVLGLSAAPLYSEVADTGTAAAVDPAHAVVELRQYTLLPGRRDELIAIFDSRFVESQEEHGMRIVGQFRDLDNPNRFVWLRSFADMPARERGLSAFYFGPVWQAHRAAANATMMDSENVLLLRPARPGRGFAATSAQRPAASVVGSDPGLIVASIAYLRPALPGDFFAFFEKDLEPLWKRAGAKVVAALETEDSANNFSRLPIRTGENVFVWFSEFADRDAFDRQQRALAASEQWQVLLGSLSLWSFQPIQSLRLEPTARSGLHGS